MEIKTNPLEKEISRVPADLSTYEDPLSKENDEKNRIINGFLRCLKRKDLTIRSELIDELLKYPDVATDALVIALLSDNRHARAMAAFALAQARHPRIVGILMNATTDECDEVRSWAVRSLGEIGDPIAIPHVMRCLNDDSEVVRAEAAFSLGKLGGHAVKECLFQCILEDKNERVRMWAGMALIEIEERDLCIKETKNNNSIDRPCILHLLETYGNTNCPPKVSSEDASVDALVASGLEPAEETTVGPLPVASGPEPTDKPTEGLLPLVNQPPLWTGLRKDSLQIAVTGPPESELLCCSHEGESESSTCDSLSDNPESRDRECITNIPVDEEEMNDEAGAVPMEQNESNTSTSCDDKRTLSDIVEDIMEIDTTVREESEPVEGHSSPDITECSGKNVETGSTPGESEETMESKMNASIQKGMEEIRESAMISSERIDGNQNPPLLTDSMSDEPKSGTHSRISGSTEYIGKNARTALMEEEEPQNVKPEVTPPAQEDLITGILGTEPVSHDGIDRNQDSNTEVSVSPKVVTPGITQEKEPVSHEGNLDSVILHDSMVNEPEQTMQSQVTSTTEYLDTDARTALVLEKTQNPEQEVSSQTQESALAEIPDTEPASHNGNKELVMLPDSMADEAEPDMQLERENTAESTGNDAGIALVVKGESENSEPEVSPQTQEVTLIGMQEIEVVPSRPVEDISGHDAAGERFDPHTAPISSPSLEVQETGQGSTISWLETARISGDAGIRCQAAVVAGSVGEMPDIPTLWCLMQDEDREVRLVAKTVFAELREKSVIDLLLKTVKGEQGSDGVHEVLLPLLSDESEELQGWAIWALGVLGDESVVEEIGRHFATGSRPVQREAVRTLALLGESGERLLLDSLHHPDPVVRSDVLAAIYQRGSQIVPAIVRMLPGMTDGQWHLYASILTMLGKGTLPYLYRELEADDELTGFRIAELLAGMGYEALVPLLEQIDKASNNKKRGILRALGLCPDPRAKEPILQALSDTDTEIRLLALRYARNLQVALSPFLLSWLDQANKDIRLEAVRTLGIEADPRAILPLMKRLKDPSEAVRTAAIQALEEIGDQIPKTSEGWIPPQ